MNLQLQHNVKTMSTVIPVVLWLDKSAFCQIHLVARGQKPQMPQTERLKLGVSYFLASLLPVSAPRGVSDTPPPRCWDPRLRSGRRASGPARLGSPPLSCQMSGFFDSCGGGGGILEFLFAFSFFWPCGIEMLGMCFVCVVCLLLFFCGIHRTSKTNPKTAST